jgi:pyruvate/2-oxoglutarate dehydrogenase complex dihydrolipoamide acyltransferase (E2) component
VFVLGSAEQFEKWANTLAEEATSAHLAQPAAGLLRALTGVAPADVALEELAAQLDAEAASAAAAPTAPETTEQAAGDSEPAAAAEADGAEKKEEAQA